MTQNLIDSQEGGPPGWPEVLHSPEGRLCATRSSWAEPGRCFSLGDEPAAELEAAGGSTARSAGLCILHGKLIQAVNHFLFCTHRFHQHHERFMTYCQKKLGAGNYCSSKSGLYPFRRGLVPLTGRRRLLNIGWEKIDSNLNREIRGTKDKLLHSICPSSPWGLVTVLLCPHPWKSSSPAP